MPELPFVDFIRTPFAVEAIEITEENLSEIARWTGEIRQTKDGANYIAVDKRIIPNISRVFPGWWLTRLGDNLRCYSPKIFEREFSEMPESGSITFDFYEDSELAEPSEAEPADIEPAPVETEFVTFAEAATRNVV